MNGKLLLSVARALILSRWRQTMVAAIGVAFSITMFIALLGFMSGLNVMLDGLVINRTPHVRIYTEARIHPRQPVTYWKAYQHSYHFISSIKAVKDRDGIYNSKLARQTLTADKRVLGIAAYLSTEVFFNNGATDLTGILNGVDGPASSRLFHFSDYVISGNAADLTNINNSIILGKALAEKLHVRLYDMVQVITPSGERFSLRLVGLYQSGLNDYDKTQGFASISTVQKLLGKPADFITEIHVKLHDMRQAPALAPVYAAIFGTQAEDIQTANEQFETGSFIRTLISYAVGITLLMVAGFGIYNILNMLIYEKMDSIAILKATGFAGADVRRIFIVIALGIGVAGGVCGLVAGYGLSYVIDQVPFHAASLPAVSTYPVNYSASIYATAFTFSLLTTYLAGYFPARKASKIDPVIIIRGK
ncbi:MAG TPA: FtsX-like permease family protein [Chitinophagaceae bacterium]|nr:FtsX-like permease family protein [Chitinophagaceae bacterium]